MKKLFDIVPPNFFGVLSSGNHEIYFDALTINIRQRYRTCFHS